MKKFRQGKTNVHADFDSRNLSIAIAIGIVGCILMFLYLSFANRPDVYDLLLENKYAEAEERMMVQAEKIFCARLYQETPGIIERYTARYEEEAAFYNAKLDTLSRTYEHEFKYADTGLGTDWIYPSELVPGIQQSQINFIKSCDEKYDSGYVLVL